MLQVVAQHVDEVLVVGDFRKEDILRHRKLHISCVPLMCCVLGGWNAVTIEECDGGPRVSRHIVTVEGA